MAMFGSIVVIVLAPWLDTSSVRSRSLPANVQVVVWVVVFDFIVLTWAGARPAEGIYGIISLAGAAYWFIYFLIILPLLGVLETPQSPPQPLKRTLMPSIPRRLQGNGRTERHMRKFAAVALLMAVAGGAGPSFSAGGSGHVEDFRFSFEGPFGKFDQEQLQRGLIVYQEVCSACHGLRYVPLRTLADRGRPSAHRGRTQGVRAKLRDFRSGTRRLPDGQAHRPLPANDSVDAPDLSLMAKARVGFSGPMGTGLTQLFRGIGGPEYMASLLSSYTGEEKSESGTILYENEAFPAVDFNGPPLEDGIVEFADGSPNSVHDLSADVTAFLTWAAEPKMMARKRAGFTAVLLLLVLSGLLLPDQQEALGADQAP